MSQAEQRNPPMSMDDYLGAVRKALDESLNLRNFPSQRIERQNKPEVETRECPELLLPVIRISRSAHEEVLIEPSINSTRVSIKIKKIDSLDHLLAGMYMRFLMQRAEQFIIMRRVPVEGYDISFLLTHVHIEELFREKLIDFIVGFMKDIVAELNERKLSVNSRARVAAAQFVGLINSPP